MRRIVTREAVDERRFAAGRSTPPERPGHRPEASGVRRPATDSIDVAAVRKAISLARPTNQKVFGDLSVFHRFEWVIANEALHGELGPSGAHRMRYLVARAAARTKKGIAVLPGHGPDLTHFAIRSTISAWLEFPFLSLRLTCRLAKERARRAIRAQREG